MLYVLAIIFKKKINAIFVFFNIVFHFKYTFCLLFSFYFSINMSI
jgi:hypothetical protein